VGDDLETINRVIYEELCLGRILEKTRTEGLPIMERLADEGAQGVILDCTELGLLIKDEFTDLPI
jgi:aspartate racemase